MFLYFRSSPLSSSFFFVFQVYDSHINRDLQAHCVCKVCKSAPAWNGRTVSGWWLTALWMKALIVLSKKLHCGWKKGDSTTRLQAIRLVIKGKRTVVTAYGDSKDEPLSDFRSSSTHETRLVSPDLPGSLVHVRRWFLRSSLESWPLWGATEPGQKDQT